VRRISTAIIFFVITLTLLSAAAAADTNSSDDRYYVNPVGGIDAIGDPYILKVDDVYYLYATSAGDRGFRVWTSLDLVNWTDRLRYALALDKDNQELKFGTGSFWAPEVIEYKGKFYMVYNAKDEDGRLKIALAVSDDPLGPFMNIKAPLFDYGKSYIDGHIFVDDDGIPYLFYTVDVGYNIVRGRKTSQIYVQQMSEDLTELIGEPVLAATPEQGWEFQSGSTLWNEGPYVLKHEEKYYMTYSSNFYGSSAYAVGLAIADHPLGPWVKYEGNPILQSDLSIGVSGPGHNSFTVSPDGTELFIVYHTHTDVQQRGGNRNLCIDRVRFEDEILVVAGPTRSPQPYPSADVTAIASLDEIKLNDRMLTGFHPSITEYRIPLPFGSADMPEVAAVPTLPGAQVELHVDGNIIEIEVTAENQVDKMYYTIEIIIPPYLQKMLGQ